MKVKWIQRLNLFSLDCLFYTFSYLILHVALTSLGGTALIPQGPAGALVLLPGMLWPLIRMKYNGVLRAFFKVRRLSVLKATLGTVIALLILFPSLGLGSYFLFAGLNLGIFLLLCPIKGLLDRKILLPAGLSPRVFRVLEGNRKPKPYEKKAI